MDIALHASDYDRKSIQQRQKFKFICTLAIWAKIPWDDESRLLSTTSELSFAEMTNQDSLLPGADHPNH